ncbi:hypothetical protein ALC60_01836 [Trachymyrmex zeteki]|uniref:Uncharacterized protein n=1 Tax=Mycetomoellerius zeteki TaxID=64791 RepID=A0A151XG41_9HYME|nr:hypothetical protein ALC60_01836 [Trachymyrmex zeteki]
MDAPGTRSDGFRIAAFPHATDIGNDQSGIMAGKLKGQMDAVTPRVLLDLYNNIGNNITEYTYEDLEAHLLPHQLKSFHFLSRDSPQSLSVDRWNITKE